MGKFIEVKEFEGHLFLHKVFVQGKEQSLVKMNFSKDNYGVALHGKMKTTGFNSSTNSWSQNTCNVEGDKEHYTSSCSHLNDFTLIVDGSSLDPILCNIALQIVNYAITIGSTLSTFALNIIFIGFLIPAAKESRIGQILANYLPANDKDDITTVYNFLQLLYYFNFTIFSSESRTTGKGGCTFIAIMNYWILMSCIVLSLFYSWKILTTVSWAKPIENFLTRLTSPKVMFISAAVIPTLLAIGFGAGTKLDFFYRNDGFCWIRADFAGAGVVIPLTILGANAAVCSLIVALRYVPGLTITNIIQGISGNDSGGKLSEIKEKIAFLFCIQASLGLPWLMQHLSLFRAEASVYHFFYSIFNGSQGIILLGSFGFKGYRMIMSKNSQNQTDTANGNKGGIFMNFVSRIRNKDFATSTNLTGTENTANEEGNRKSNFIQWARRNASRVMGKDQNGNPDTSTENGENGNNNFLKSTNLTNIKDTITDKENRKANLGQWAREAVSKVIGKKFPKSANLTNIEDVVTEEGNKKGNLAQWTKEGISNVRKFDRFIFPLTVGGCAGLGNQMFRIAALYGIGLYPNVNRTPGLSGSQRCLDKYFKEFSETFPNVVKLVKFEDLTNKKFAQTMFGRRMYEDPEVIHDVPDEYLVINHGYIHGIRYFSHIMNDIHQLFEFHPKIKDQVEEYGTQLFISDKFSHKMCVHIRRNDFITHRLLETRPEFLIPAMSTVRNFISKKYPKKNISLIVIGDDEKFVDKLEFPRHDYLNIYRPILPSRGAAMYFGIRYCDSLLNSASGSTFSTWIGLLMPEGKDVFYNRRVFKNISEDMGTDYVDYERHSKNWNILELDEKSGTGASPQPGNISSIMNKTLEYLNITELSGDDLFIAVGVFEICSKVKQMKTEDFHGMAYFLDKLIEAPASAYMDANNGDQRTGNTLLTSINRMMINSPHNVSYLSGANIALIGRPVDCSPANK
ncbi:hypothetical protein FO519_009356, partial [Halicephalobus sp. NKZ332]